MSEKSQILDEFLVLQIQQGDQEALSQLILKWHKKLLYQSHIRTGDWEQAEDIVQDVWQWLIANLRKLEGVNSFGPWIRTIVDRRSIDWVRKQKHFRKNQTNLCDGDNRTADSGFTIDSDHSEDADEQQLAYLEEAMGELSPENRLLLLLYYKESCSIETISGILKIPKGTVKSRLFHIREKLKKSLKSSNYERSK